MTLRECSFFADENIHPEVLIWMAAEGFDVVSVADRRLLGHTDAEIFHAAYRENRILISHDSDFGKLAIAGGEPYWGIIYLRPGHIAASFTIETIKTLLMQALVLHAPFIVIAERRNNSVKVRLRQPKQ